MLDEAFATWMMAQYERPLGPPLWLSQPVGRFVLHYGANTDAERSLELIASRLEGLHAATVATLGLDAVESEPIHVFLTELSDEAPDADVAGADPAAPEPRRRISAVYRYDAPGEELNDALVELLLSEWLGNQAAPPRFLVNGLLGVATQRARQLDPDRVDMELDQQRRQGRSTRLVEVLSASAEGRRDLQQAATSLVRFLLRAYDSDRLRQLGQRLSTSSVDEAVAVTYGKPPAVLEKQWQSSWKTEERPLLGLLGFFPTIWPYLRPFLGSVLLIVVMLFLYRGPQLLGPTITKFLIDQGIVPRDAGAAALAVGAIVGLVVLQALGSFGREYLSYRTGATVMNNIRRRMFDHLQRLSLDFYVQSRAGDLISRLSSDLAHIESAITYYLPLVFTFTMSIVFSLIVLFLADWRLALVSLLGLLLLPLLPRLMGRGMDEAGYQRQKLVGEAGSFEQENLTTQSTIKAFGLQRRQMAAYQQLIERVASGTTRVGFLGGLYGTAIGGVAAVVELTTIGIGTYLVFAGEVTIGILVLFLQQVAIVVNNVQALHWTIHPIQDASGGMQRVEELLAERPTVVDAPDARPLPPFSREIRFDDVSFSYTGEQVNLDQVSLTIPAGRSVALVGGSGSGKSTLLNLIMRFYDPTVGRVTIDGHDLRQVTQTSLRDQMAVVLQDTSVLNASIRENIRLGRVDATDEEVEAAARAAELHEFVESLPDGYDTVVGERGGRLSGGQRQRIAIARAILRNPPILLLDEPTSALDARTEMAVQATLNELARGRTVVTVTHRLAATVEADIIYVFDAGQVVEQGSHQELLAYDGYYQRLWRQQHGAVELAGDQVQVELERLTTIPLFKRMDPSLLTDLTTRFAIARQEPGDTLFEPGDPVDKLYLIVHGEVEIVATEPGGERRLAVLRSGEHFGEIALQRAATRTTSARVRTPATLLVLEREQLLKSMAHVLSLPDDQRQLVIWLTRRREASLAEVASHLGLDQATTRAKLEPLVDQGYLQTIERAAEPHYRPSFGTRRVSRLRPEMWRALDGL